MSGHQLSFLDCSCYLTIAGYSQASFISATLLQVFLITSAASCCTVITTLFRILHVTFTVSCTTFLRVLQVTLTAPYSTIIATSLSLSCDFRGFVLHCQHDSFMDPSCNFHGFMHNFSLGHLCSCHGFVLHCQHGSSLNLLDNLRSFCQLSSDRLLCSTTRILYTFTLILSSHVHTF